jgi:hypothetical protein
MSDIDNNTKQDRVTANIARQKAADDGFNTHDMHAFEALHTDDVKVYLTGRTEPTTDIHTHRADTEALIEAFPDITVDNNPYRTTFGGGDWTCAMSLMRGTHTGPLRTPGGQVIEPTGKSFAVNFATMCRWDDNGKIAEEYVMWDAPALMEQLGLA